MRRPDSLDWDGTGWSGPVYCAGCPAFLIRLDRVTGRSFDPRPCRNQRCKQIDNTVDVSPPVLTPLSSD